MTVKNCPNCDVSFQGAPIPDKYFVHDTTSEEHFRAIKQLGRCVCLHYGDLAPEDRFFSRLIGVELPEDHPDHYDGVSLWLCPDCDYRWSR